MDEIYRALCDEELTPREAAERVLYHPEFGGTREDAIALVLEWCQQIDDLITESRNE